MELCTRPTDGLSSKGLMGGPHFCCRQCYLMTSPSSHCLKMERPAGKGPGGLVRAPNIHYLHATTPPRSFNKSVDPLHASGISRHHHQAYKVPRTLSSTSKDQPPSKFFSLSSSHLSRRLFDLSTNYHLTNGTINPHC